MRAQGRCSPRADYIDQLIDAIAAQSRQLQAANQRIAELEKKLAGLEKKLGGAVTTKLDRPFSPRAEEQRQAARGKKSRNRQRPLRRGRVTTAEKISRLNAPRSFSGQRARERLRAFAHAARVAAGKRTGGVGGI